MNRLQAVSDPVVQGAWGAPTMQTDGPWKQQKAWVSWIKDLPYHVAGIVKNVADHLEEERPTLRGIGYQLIGIWLLYLCILGFAFATLTGDWRIALAVASLAATLIWLADRMFLAADWRNEGKLLVLRATGAPDRRLFGVFAQRLGTMLVRFGFGIFMAFNIVVLAVPGLFPHEVKGVIKQMSMEQNRPIFNDLGMLREIKAKEWQDKKEQLRRLEGQLVEAEQAINQLNGAVVPLVGIDPSVAEKVRGLRQSARELRNQQFVAQECAEAEKQGIPNSSCAAIPPSAKPGCAQRCKLWLAKAETLGNQAHQIETEIARVEGEDAKNIAHQAEQVETQQDEVTRLRAQVAVMVQAVDAAQTAWQRVDQDFQATKRTEWVEVEPGIVQSYKAAERVLAGAGDGVAKTLFSLKLMMILLESIVFISRLLGGATQSYSRLMYQRYLDRFERSKGTPERPSPGHPASALDLRQPVSCGLQEVAA